MRRPVLIGLAAAVVLAGGAGVYTFRASGPAPTDDAADCPAKETLRNPIIDFTQAPRHYVTVTLTNVNDCYGFLDEPVEISLYGPNGRRGISYYGDGPPHSDVGVCCTVTLPPHGTWTIRLGNPVNAAGYRDWRICNVHVEALRSQGLDVWKPMPAGGSIVGRGSFPPDFTPKTSAEPNNDPTWLAPCETEAPLPTPTP